MGARVCLRFAVISYIVSSWNMYEIFVAGREATKKKKPINQSTNHATRTLKQLISNTGEYQIY